MGRGENRHGGRRGRGQEEEWGNTVQNPSPGAFYKGTSEWLTSGPERSYHIPKQSRARDTWRKRRRRNRGVYALSHPSAAVRPASRASQNSDPTKSANGRSICQTMDFLRSVARKFIKCKSSLDLRKEWIKATEIRVAVINKRLLVQNDTYPEHKDRSEIISTPSSLKPRSIRGLMMKPCT